MWGFTRDRALKYRQSGLRSAAALLSGERIGTLGDDWPLCSRDDVREVWSTSNFPNYQHLDDNSLEGRRPALSARDPAFVKINYPRRSLFILSFTPFVSLLPFHLHRGTKPTVALAPTTLCAPVDDKKTGGGRTVKKGGGKEGRKSKWKKFSRLYTKRSACEKSEEGFAKADEFYTDATFHNFHVLGAFRVFRVIIRA